MFRSIALVTALVPALAACGSDPVPCSCPDAAPCACPDAGCETADAGPGTPDAGPAVEELTLTGRASLGVDTCSPPYEIRVFDAEGAPLPATQAVTVESDLNSPIFFADAACATPLDGAVIDRGGLSGAFHLKTGARGALHLTARHGTHTATLEVKVRARPAELHLGSEMACGVHDGKLLCLGRNVAGNLADGSRNTRLAPVEIALPAAPTQVALSRISAQYDQQHACAIADGKLYCWGKNDCGQIGDGTGGGLEAAAASLDRLTPTEVTLPAAPTQVVAGTRHTCALAGGEVYCWGLDHVRSSNVPVKIDGVGTVASLVAGSFFTCALRTDGTAACWGWQQAGTPGLGDGTATTHVSTPVQVVGVSGATALAAGAYHACALAGGALRCWGADWYGNLGTGTVGEARVAVVVPAMAEGVSAVAAGTFHTCAIRNGAAFCWGRNDWGQVGDGTREMRTLPTAVTGLGSGVTRLWASDNSTCALAWGETFCWGADNAGQLGTGAPAGSAVPVAIPGLESGATAVAAAGSHACALRDGKVRCWGANGSGQAGQGYLGGDFSAPAADVAGLSGVTKITAGLLHTCALAGGAVRCWGANGNGVSGRDPAAHAAVPAPWPISGLDAGVTDLASANYGTCALRNGAVLCWGRDYEKGLTSASGAGVPRAVPGLESGVTALGGGGETFCAVKDGASWCWGRGDTGQLGNGVAQGGVYTGWSVPVAAAQFANATAFAGGTDFTCALVSGSARCTGLNAFGTLGDGTWTSTLTATTVSGLTGATKLAPRRGTNWRVAHACAVTGGALKCWGYNGDGQLGDGTRENRNVATAVGGLADVTDAAIGPSYTCAVAAGKVWCWGAEGMLGRPNQAALAPVPALAWDLP